ncbi:MAG: hypothetical protein KBC78_02305 [Candidatus Pacebacteria bacterium]|nr:hypothetical protein [Candidatus Paceibacterota bacterium]
MRYIFLLPFIFLSYGVFTMPAVAAVIKVESDFSALHVGDVFTVDVVIDTEKQTLNAIETDIIFPSNLLEYVLSDDGDSVISLWIKKPNFHDSNVITLSGITPGGFNQKDTKIMSLTFKVLHEGQGNIENTNTKLLLHDGLGTEASTKQQNLHLSIVEGDSNISVNTVDEEIPERFNPEIIQDEDVFEGKYALIFSTKDKGSGMDHYEVKEGWFGKYQNAESPYELKHQLLDKKIFVKAIDLTGNERIEILYPQNWKPWYEQTGVIVSILILCVLTLFIFWRFFRFLLRK